MNVTRVYLDTSALVKRYVKEEGSDQSDSYFQAAQRGESIICLSEINLGEAAVVFDKYSRKWKIDGKNRFQVMLSELERLERSSSVEVYPVSSSIIRKSIHTVWTQHIYINDAIQLETCIEAQGNVFCSADKELITAAGRMGLETVQL